MNSLISPERLWSRAEVLDRPCPVPAEPGVYSWFFRDLPGPVTNNGCVTHNGLTLLYVGISPDKPNRPDSKQSLRTRLKYHFQGNAEGSTLRLTLGALLEDELDVQLRRVGSGKRMTLTHQGEQRLDDWLEKNSKVSWLIHPTPWELEDQLLGSISLPLNLKGNSNHPFHSRLTGLRKTAKDRARKLPVADERGTAR